MKSITPIIVLVGFGLISWLAIPQPDETAKISAETVVETIDSTITPEAQAMPQSEAPTQPQAIKTPQRVDGNCESHRHLLAQYDWDVNIALAVMQAESGCVASSYNGTWNTDGTNDAGPMQINSIHVDSGLIGWDERFDPERNIAVAYQLYADRLSWDSNGWNAWSTYLNGKYLEFLK